MYVNTPHATAMFCRAAPKASLWYAMRLMARERTQHTTTPRRWPSAPCMSMGRGRMLDAASDWSRLPVGTAGDV